MHHQSTIAPTKRTWHGVQEGRYAESVISSHQPKNCGAHLVDVDRHAVQTAVVRLCSDKTIHSNGRWRRTADGRGGGGGGTN